MEKDILEVIIQAQKKRDLTDGKFAALVGVSDSYWSLVKNGHRAVTPSLLTKVMANVPELQWKISNYLITAGQK